MALCWLLDGVRAAPGWHLVPKLQCVRWIHRGRGRLTLTLTVGRGRRGSKEERHRRSFPAFSVPLTSRSSYTSLTDDRRSSQRCSRDRQQKTTNAGMESRLAADAVRSETERAPTKSRDAHPTVLYSCADGLIATFPFGTQTRS